MEKIKILISIVMMVIRERFDCKREKFMIFKVRHAFRGKNWLLTSQGEWFDSSLTLVLKIC